MAGLVHYGTHAGVATITLARPEKYNALTSALLHEIGEALARAGDDEAVRVVVLTGSGRAFCSGQDLMALPEGGAAVGDVLERDYRPVMMALVDHPKVTVAALNGAALGAGLSLALGCDIRVAAEGATLCQAFVKIGLIPDAGGTWLLPRLTGLGNALALTLTGDTISAREAQGLGLVYRVFPDETFGEEVARMTEKLAGWSPLACGLIKKSLRASLANSLDDQLALEARFQSEAAESEPFSAALAAFRSRRR